MNWSYDIEAAAGKISTVAFISKEVVSVEINIPRPVQEVLDMLRAQNYQAYIVGGCLRDTILGRGPRDWDLVTSAEATCLPQAFAPDVRVVPTGVRFGTVTVFHDGIACEVSSFRDTNLEADLGRRDFTVNAMAWSPDTGLIDHWQGRQDLSKGILRMTDTEARFHEDPLRLLRGIRLAVDLDFQFAPGTLDAIRRLYDLVGQVSPERIRDELVRLLVSASPRRGLELMRITGLLDEILPDIAACVGFVQHHPAHNQDVYEHTLTVVEGTPPELAVRLAALFHDVAKPRCFRRDPQGRGSFCGHEQIGADMAGQVLRHLCFDNLTIAKVKNLISQHMLALSYPQMQPSKLINRIGAANLPDLFALQRADILASNFPEDVEHVDDMARKTVWTLAMGKPTKRKDLAIDGHDLLAQGIPRGPELGLILDQLVEAVLADPNLNEREALLSRARRLFQELGEQA